MATIKSAESCRLIATAIVIVPASRSHGALRGLALEVVEPSIHLFDTLLCLPDFFVKSVEEVVLVERVPVSVGCPTLRRCWVDRLRNQGRRGCST